MGRMERKDKREMEVFRDETAQKCSMVFNAVRVFSDLNYRGGLNPVNVHCALRRITSAECQIYLYTKSVVECCHVE